MRTVSRPRRYVSPVTLTLTRPLLALSAPREAYVLRVVGNRYGPVLRLDRRRRAVAYDGAERRAGAKAGEARSSLFQV